MANYNKSFNFRNGIQVDSDNFVVNANGLVGIGTTIPKNYLLNVHGDVSVTGLITASNLNIGVLTATTIKTTNVSASSSITASTFYGSASGLTGIYGIAVDGWYVSGGNISTSSNVGIGTTLPTGNFQVGTGVTINNYGGATYTGIITALSLEIAGFTTTKNLSVSGISTFNSNIDLNASIDISGHTELDQLNVSGVSTLTTLRSTNTNVENLNATGISTFANIGITNLNASGVSTFTTLGVTGATTTQNLRVSGVSTITTLGVIGVTTTQNLRVSGITTLSIVTVESIYSSGIITANTFIGSLSGTASTAQSLTGNPNINVTNISASDIQAGIVTATTKLYTEFVGVGTSSSSSDIHVRRSGQSFIQVTSDTNTSIIGLGRSASITGYNGLLRYGNTSAFFPYSDSYSLDILNYGPGNVNFYLEASNVSAGTTGSFYWHRKPNFARLMTLTYDGKLGIGVTLPSQTLEVAGTARVDSDAYFGNDVEISNNLVVNNDLTVDSNFTFNGPYISANLEGNVNSVTGVSTFFDIDITNSTQTRLVGVGTTALRSSVDFADAGKDYTGGTKAFMIVPRLNDTERTGLTTESGAIIFNTSTNTFQGYTGSSWVDFH